MASLALYLKYRPQSFEQVVGQEPITRTLQNALREGRIRHAYLFTGPRGTGKTTTARILAKAVNCLAPAAQRPCNSCAICTAINQARLLDLIEIDAASNRGIDEIRDIREKVGFRPGEAQYKVYVLDEAHMLTEPAFNALLKTLEEPPPHVIFVLVTTEPHKIPATIASRCQRFDFRRVPLLGIVNRLAEIAELEHLRVEPAALELIARHGGGAVRDAISLLDQLAGYGDEVTLAEAQMVLGTAAGDAAGKLVACLAAGDVAGGLQMIDRTLADGTDPRQLGREVVEYLRSLLLIQQGAGTRLLSSTAEQAAEMEALAGEISTDGVLHAIHLFNAAATNLRRGLESIPQLSLEMAFVESVWAGSEAGRGDRGSGFGQGGSAASRRSQAPRDEASEQVGLHARLASADLPVHLAAEHPKAAPAEAESEGEMQRSVRAELAALTPSQSGEGPSTQPATVALSLEQVQQAWGKVLDAVRQRNKTTQAVLASNCQPVEVTGNQIVVTVPSSILADKLRDPQRTLEVEDAVAEALQTRCRIKWVLASEFKLRSPAQPPATGSAEPTDDQVPDPIAQWAQERGGKARLIRS